MAGGLGTVDRLTPTHRMDDRPNRAPMTDPQAR